MTIFGLYRREEEEEDDEAGGGGDDFGLDVGRTSPYIQEYSSGEFSVVANFSGIRLFWGDLLFLFVIYLLSARLLLLLLIVCCVC